LREKLKAWMVETKDPLLEGDVPAPEGAELNDPDGLSPNEPTIVT
jgi:N-sulfoglucosamine sulfohydrolase